METTELISRTEQKRRAQGLEELAAELVALPLSRQQHLPCEERLRAEIISATSMQAGARRRQIKYLAKQLRMADPEPLLAFLETERGSRLKRDQRLHEMERLRDAIVNEAIAALSAPGWGSELPDWDGEGYALAQAAREFPGLDQAAIKIAARRYAKTRKPIYSREVFRLLKAALGPGERLV